MCLYFTDHLDHKNGKFGLKMLILCGVDSFLLGHIFYVRSSDMENMCDLKIVLMFVLMLSLKYINIF